MLRTIKISVVFLFVLVSTALVLSIMLYNRRQMLLGRILSLESGITMVAATLEENIPDTPAPLTLVDRDIDSVSAAAIDTPRTSSFWMSYRQCLEIPATDTIKLSDRKRELQTFFKIDPVTQKPLRDPITRERIWKGPGTTDGVLKDVVSSAEQQLNRLNETRYQLTALRTEYQETTAELNRYKHELRSALCDIVDRDNQIVAAQNTLKIRNATIAERENQLTELNDQIFDSKHLIAQQIEDIDRLSYNVATWQAKYQNLLGRDKSPQQKTWTAMRIE